MVVMQYQCNIRRYLICAHTRTHMYTRSQPASGLGGGGASADLGGENAAGGSAPTLLDVAGQPAPSTNSAVSAPSITGTAPPALVDST